MGVAKSFGLQRSESDFTAHRLEIRNSANYQDFSCDFLRPFSFSILMQHPQYVPMWIYTSWLNAIQPLAQMTTWLYDVGITMSCKTTLNIPIYYSYLQPECQAFLRGQGRGDFRWRSRSYISTIPKTRYNSSKTAGFPLQVFEDSSLEVSEKSKIVATQAPELGQTVR